MLRSCFSGGVLTASGQPVQIRESSPGDIAPKVATYGLPITFRGWTGYLHPAACLLDQPARRRMTVPTTRAPFGQVVLEGHRLATVAAQNCIRHLFLREN